MRLSKKKTHKRYKKKLRGGVNPPSSHPPPRHPSIFTNPSGDTTPSHPPPSHPSLFIRQSLFPQPINPNDLIFELYKYHDNAKNITEMYHHMKEIGLLDADNECFRNLYEREELPLDDAIFNMLYNPRTDLWICTTRDGTYVAHASVNYDTEIQNLLNFPKNNTIIEPEYKCNLIWNVCVSLAYRKRHICQLLINTILSREYEQNKLPFALNVVRDNRGAEKCYESSGFKFFTTNESINIMTTIPDLPIYIPMETRDEEDVLCQGLSDIKLKGKMVFLYIISHGELLPLVIHNHAMLKKLERVSMQTFSTNKIFPDIKGNENLLKAVNKHPFKPTLFPFYISDSKLNHAHTMHMIALESGCVSLLNLDTNLYISNLLSTLVGNENLNRKVVFDELKKRLDEYNNLFISLMVSQCLTGRKHPSMKYYHNNLLLDTPSKRCERIQTQFKKKEEKMVLNKDAFKVAQNWPAMPQCVKPSERILQNNKVYTCLYNDVDDENKEKYNQLIRFVKNDIIPGLELNNEEYYRKNPLIKLYFKTDDGKDVFLNVPTHQHITLTDVLNRVSYILGLYGMNNSEIVIVDNSCGHKDPDSFSYAGGKTKKKKKVYKKKRRTVRRPLRG